MGKLLTEKFYKKWPDSEEKFVFSYDINVDKDGYFSTTLPKDIVKIFTAANIRLGSNRLKREGYFTHKELKGLKDEIEDAVDELMSRELISEKTIIRYIIQTRCSYCLDVDGKIVPNGGREWTKTDDYHWKDGTVPSHASAPTPFGFLIYAKPFFRRDYKYKSGAVKTVYDAYSAFGGGSTKKDDGYYLKWLEGVSTITTPDEEDVQEVEYNENIAKFFVEMIISICKINERIKDFLHPEAIKEIAMSGKKMLG